MMSVRRFLLATVFLPLLSGCVKHVRELEDVEQKVTVNVNDTVKVDYISAQRNDAGELISLVFNSADTLSTRISIVPDSQLSEYRLNWAVGDTVWLCAVGDDDKFTGKNYPFCCAVFSKNAVSAQFDIAADINASLPNGNYIAYHFVGGNAPKLVKPRAGDAAFELNYGSSKIKSLQLACSGVDFFGQPATQYRNNFLMLSGRLDFSGDDLPKPIRLNSPMSLVEYRIYPAPDASSDVKSYWINGYPLSTQRNSINPGVLLTSFTNDGTTPNPIFASVLKLDTYGNIDEAACSWSDSLALSVSSVNAFTTVSYNYLGGKSADNPVVLSTVVCQKPSSLATPSGRFRYKIGLAASNVLTGNDIVYAAGEISPLNFPADKVSVLPIGIKDVVNEQLVTTVINIDSEADLLALQNSGPHAGEVINLNCDIDFTASGSISEANPWRPISKEGEAFSGTFNGNGHTIKGLTSGKSDFSGDIGSFFGPAANASVSNLTITDAKVYAENVVHPNGSFNNCIFFGGGAVTGDVGIVNCKIINSEIHPYTSNSGGVDDANGTGNGRYHAGFVGLVRSGTVTISNCTVDNLKIIPTAAPGTTAMNVNFTGGMVGGISGASASVVITNSTVKDCLLQAGQLACGGFVAGIDTDGGNLTITGCELTATTAPVPPSSYTVQTTSSQQSGAGGFVGQIAQNLSNSTTLITNSRVTGLVTIKGSANSTGGKVGGCGGVVGLCGNDSEKLTGTCNIIIDGCSVGANVSISSNANCATGGIVGNSKLCNGVIIIKNCSNSATMTLPTSNTNSLQGGIVGQNQSPNTLVFGSKSNATITFGTVAQMRVGGIIGNNQGGAVIACYSESSITTTSTSTAATNAIGGIAGSNSGTIMACYLNGDVAVTTAAANTNLKMGIISGLTGYWNGATPAFVSAKSTVQNCYWATGSYALKNGNEPLAAVGTSSTTITGNATNEAFAAPGAWPAASQEGWGTNPISLLAPFEAVYPLWGSGPWRAGYDTSTNSWPRLAWEN